MAQQQQPAPQQQQQMAQQQQPAPQQQQQMAQQQQTANPTTTDIVAEKAAAAKINWTDGGGILGTFFTKA
jgi:hypothetical protein